MVSHKVHTLVPELISLRPDDGVIYNRNMLQWLNVSTLVRIYSCV